MRAVVEIRSLMGVALVLLGVGCSRQAEGGEAMSGSRSERSKSGVTSQRVEQLRLQLAASNSTDRIVALKALGEIGLPARAALPEVKALIREDDYFIVRGSACYTIVMIAPDDESTVPILVVALKDSSAPVRMFAVAALGKLGQTAQAAIPDLVWLARKDPEESVRGECRRVLPGIMGPDATKSLRQLAGNE